MDPNWEDFGLVWETFSEKADVNKQTTVSQFLGLLVIQRGHKWVQKTGEK